MNQPKMPNKIPESFYRNPDQTSVLTILNSWMLRFFLYSCLGMGLMLINYDFRSGCLFLCEPKMMEAQQYMLSISKLQQLFYYQFKIVSNSLEDLEAGMDISQSKHYNYRILSPMKPAPTLNEIHSLNFHPKTTVFFATPKQNVSGLYQSKTFIGYIFIMNKKLETSICHSETQTLLFPIDFPTTPLTKIECPAGFSEVDFYNLIELERRRNR
ncbi:MAG: type IV pilin-like G/H family protein [Microcoleaceae cyanobacterium MO_207.B10]|nr:type IV pilin-like G/H family protein [Microcoleaceae cyanobacterium MO_207.B10]